MILDIYQLEAIGQNWYERTHRLREVWQDETIHPFRRMRAKKLFDVMLIRVLAVSRILTNKNPLIRALMDHPLAGPHHVGVALNIHKGEIIIPAKETRV